MAVRQRSLTKSLLAVLKRIPVISQDERSESERAVAAASLRLAEIAWPRSWLRRNVEAARTVLASLDGVTNHFASGDKDRFARLLDLEQALLAKRKVALDGVWCSHLRDSSAFEKKLIVPVLYYERHGHGHFGVTKLWCRHCLVSWEQHTEFAVSGGH